MNKLWRGLVIVLAVLGFVGLSLTMLITVVAISLGSSPPDVPPQAVLRLDLDGQFREGGVVDPLAALSDRPIYDLYGTVEALDRAATDDRVVGLFATLNDATLGLAQIQELRQAILRFRDSGKPAVVFSESINGIGGYYLASAFTTVALQPSGSVDTVGLVAEAPFLRDTLEMIGIKPELAGRKEYKSAIETLTETKYSPAHAENVNALLNSWLGQISRDVADSRGLAVPQTVTLLGNGPHLASSAKAQGLVTDLSYWDQAWEVAAGVPWGDDEAPEELDVADYGLRSLPHDGKTGTRLALVVGEGEIHRGPSRETWDNTTGFGSETIAEAIRTAADDKEIKGIIFRINSPGGSYTAADTIWYEVDRARKLKPVVVSMGNAAASGGYFVAAPASAILALPGTVTGSIGVFSGKLVLKELWDKLKVHWDSIERGQSAGIWSPNRSFNEWGWAKLNGLLDAIYADFSAKVVAGRHLTPEEVEAVAKGRVWTGEEAVERGLVDSLGGLVDAKQTMRRLLKLDDNARLDMAILPEPDPSWRRLTRVLSGNVQAQGQLRQLMMVLEPLQTLLGPLAPLQSRTPQALAPVALPQTLGNP